MGKVSVNSNKHLHAINPTISKSYNFVIQSGSVWSVQFVLCWRVNCAWWNINMLINIVILLVITDMQRLISSKYSATMVVSMFISIFRQLVQPLYMSSWDNGGSRYANDMDIYDSLEPVLCNQSLISNPPPHDPLASSPAVSMLQEPLMSAIPTPGEPNLTTTNLPDEALLCSLWSEEFW